MLGLPLFAWLALTTATRTSVWLTAARTSHRDHRFWTRARTDCCRGGQGSRHRRRRPRGRMPLPCLLQTHPHYTLPRYSHLRTAVLWRFPLSLGLHTEHSSLNAPFVSTFAVRLCTLANASTAFVKTASKSPSVLGIFLCFFECYPFPFICTHDTRYAQMIASLFQFLF